jgi:hypothetical protein
MALLHLLSTPYQYKLTEDQTEIFSNDQCEIVIPFQGGRLKELLYCSYSHRMEKDGTEMFHSMSHSIVVRPSFLKKKI